jgi:hypothetical protein
MSRVVSRIAIVAGVLAAATWFVATRLERPGMIAHDVYGYYYPNMLYAVAQLRDGGAGLLWNPYQSCGTPFFPSSQTGLLYPANAFFLVLPPGLALRAAVWANLVLAGLFAYALGRELGAGRLAALAGALAFELGNGCIRLAAWAPMMIAPYVWLPAAMLFCERLLRAPTARRAIGLGVALAVSLLPGYPQTVFFAYQLIALRVAWELVTTRAPRPAASLVAIAAGLVLPALLAAVQLLPALEVARASVRPAALTLSEMSPTGFLDWNTFRTQVGLHNTIHSPFVVVPCVLGAAAVVAGRRRRIALFYVLAGALYLALAFGPNTPLFRLYLALPLGATFREPVRFMWLTSFSLAVVTALGVEALAGGGGGRRAARVALVVAAVGAAVGYAALGARGLFPVERATAAAVVVVAAAASVAPRLRPTVAPLALVALVVNLVAVPRAIWLRLLPDDGALYQHAPLFERLRARMTPQDRVYLIHQSPEATAFALTRKSASLFRVPSIHDFDPQPSRRYGELFVMLRLGRRMASLNDVYYMPEAAPIANHRLLDVTGVRYLVVAAAVDHVDRITPPPHLVDADDDVRVYELPAAMPRAHWVPRVDVVPDPDALLARLARPDDDLRAVALVERAPASGFAGAVADPGSASTEFVDDRPEHVALRVRAPAPGFVVLADQDLPGWRATVDGRPATILRANYAFRAVEVPAGSSLVEFRYAPATLWAGLAISGATLVAVGAVLAAARRRP